MADRRYALIGHTHPASAGALNDLTDVTLTSPTTGDVLRYNGTAWVNYPDSNYAAASHTHVKADITDFAHTHVIADVTDVTATAGELNLLDLSGLTAGWALIADSATTASWQAIPGGGPADGTTTNSMLRWSGSAWVEQAGIRLETGANAELWINNVADIITGFNDTSVPFAVGNKTSGGQFVSFDATGVIQGQNASAAASMQINPYGGSVSIGDSSSPSASHIVNLNNYKVRVVNGSFEIAERTDDLNGTAGYGQFWVQNRVPNRPWFTDDANNKYPLAFAEWLNVSEDANDVCDWQYMNGVYFKDGTTAITLTLEASTVTTFEVGSTTAIINAHATTGNITVTEGTGTTLYVLDGTTVADSLGSSTIAPGGYATLYRHSAAVYYLMGAGITA